MARNGNLFFATALTAAMALTTQTTQAQSQSPNTPPSFGLAGILSKSNREELPPLTLASGQPLAQGPMTLRSGGYYVLPIICDGSAELGVIGPAFFRAIWIDEVIINSMEVRPLGLDSLECDDEGTFVMRFVAIKPGRYEIKIPHTRGDSQRVDITIQ